MNNKEKYYKFCIENNIEIFSQPWWLDITSGEDKWDVLLVEKGGSIQGALPYSFNRKKNTISISQASLTPRNGILLNYPKNQKLTSKVSFERKVIKELIEELENLDLTNYNQNYNYNFNNWLPLYWNGFKQTTRYSYIINYDSKWDEKDIDSATRNLIRKAEKFVSISENISIEEFYKINTMTYSRKGMVNPYSMDLVKRLDNECVSRNCRKILCAKDNEGNIHAAIYLVWDNNSVYYLMGGVSPEFKSTNATSMLLLNAIKFSLENELDFDFEGSMIESIEKFFSSFGAVRKEYYNISKGYKVNFRSIISDVINNSKSLRRIIKRR